MAVTSNYANYAVWATCPEEGSYHEYRVQDGRVICALHGRWLGKVK